MQILATRLKTGAVLPSCRGGLLRALWDGASVRHTSALYHGQMHIGARQRQEIAKICHRYGVRRLQMFGSAARGDDTPASDVDLLVEFAPGQVPTGFALVDLQDALSLVFHGRAVDLAFPSVLDNPYRRRAIEPDLQSLFQ